ncbi:28108_t:CDS:2 [Gigaspora margarita]|uniref:28108_t:CDS:1 n=1 Tax=Gigaspora margarita TaxID=4874 RepID=A0ABN7X0F8_GIGMA|nr:28108_t:CDS:2 [Gigaspora margarita]
MMVEVNSNIGPAHQNLLQSNDPKGLQENDNKIALLIESMKTLSISINGRDTEVVCDSGSDSPNIPNEIVKKLGLEINKSLPDIADKAVSDIVKQNL